MVVAERVDSTGVAFSADLEDRTHHIEGVLKLALIFEEGKQRRQLFAGEEIFLADAVPHDHDEFAVGGN